MLSQTPIAAMRLAHIATDEAEALRFEHSPANANPALRTLRRMMGKAAEWGMIAAAPRIKLMKEQGAPQPSTARPKPDFSKPAHSRFGTC